MARLIDAEDVLRDKVWFCGGFVSDDFSMGYMEALDKVETVIRNAPTVDAVPVVRGRWIEKQEPIPWCEDYVDVFTVCSACNCCSIGESNYCPNCGAKMDLEVKDA